MVKIGYGPGAGWNAFLRNTCHLAKAWESHAARRLYVYEIHFGNFPGFPATHSAYQRKGFSRTAEKPAPGTSLIEIAYSISLTNFAANLVMLSSLPGAR